ncbi:MAG: hypothetical protein H7X84_12905 [Verrucomicrobia bacterium]|nr:hypothetical protein [Prolixibacteraceae bacterium]
MATFVNGILGGFSGKVGTVIGSYWNGIEYMRSRAAHVTQPNTPAQLEQRAKFALVGKFLRPLIPFLRVSYKTLALKKSAFNAAMAHTLENAVTGIYPTFEIDYSQVLVCQGNLLGAENASVISTTANTINFTWENNSTDYGADATDKVALVVYCPALQKFVTAIGTATRLTGSQTMTLPTVFASQEVQTYIGFCNTAMSEFSNGEFLAAVTVQ